MTSTTKPTHPYAFWLFVWESTLGLGALICVLITYPSKANNGVQPTVISWSLYALCLVVLFCRLTYALFKECSSVNRLAKLAEYQTWTESFATTIEGRPIVKKTTAAQFRPWWNSVIVVCLGIGLLVTGKMLNRPNLFEVNISGGYLIGVVFPVALLQASWRFPAILAFNRRIVDRLIKGSEPGFEKFDLVPTIHNIKAVFNGPSITYGRGNLETAFGDPLYLPETYKR